MAVARTYILGLGNVLMGDDGFGPWVVRAFEEQYVVGAGAEVVDLGTPGLDLTPWLADVRDAIIVDTVRADDAPGTLRLYEKRDITRQVPFPRVSPHDPGVKETVLTLEFAGRAPHTITLIGVVPERVAMGTALSAAVHAAVPGAVAAIVAALERCGVTVRRRPRQPVRPPSPDIFRTLLLQFSPEGCFPPCSLVRTNPAAGFSAIPRKPC
jgi:hydrogenase maturation protease